MDILEMDPLVGPVRPGTPDEGFVVAVTPDRLGLPPGPEFLSPGRPADGSGPRTLWERLSLSWRDPQLARDLLG